MWFLPPTVPCLPPPTTALTAPMVCLVCPPVSKGKAKHSPMGSCARVSHPITVTMGHETSHSVSNWDRRVLLGSYGEGEPPKRAQSLTSRASTQLCSPGLLLTLCPVQGCSGRGQEPCRSKARLHGCAVTLSVKAWDRPSLPPLQASVSPSVTDFV